MFSVCSVVNAADLTDKEIETLANRNMALPHVQGQIIVTITEEASGFTKRWDASEFPGIKIENIEYLTSFYENPEAMDVNGDGTVNMRDLVEMTRLQSGWC